jgi:hypothetical protein
MISLFLMSADVYAQDANNPEKFDENVRNTTDEIVDDVVVAGERLARGGEKALKNEAQRDLQLVERAAPTRVPPTPTQTTQQMLEAEVEDLKEQADRLQ